MNNQVGGRIDGLDALRGFAILLVLLRHAFPSVFGGAGIVGVMVFFVLSGYLITRILLKDISNYGGVRYARFYRNRFLRLIPPLAFFIAGLCVVSLTWNPLGDRGGLLRAVVIALTYTANIPFDLRSPAIAHLWTLATEEQFYLVWPLLLLLSFRRQRFGWLFVTSVVVIAGGISLSFAVFSGDLARIYGIFTSWAIGLVVGAACAVYGMQMRRWATGVRFKVAVPISACILLLAAVAPEPKAQWWGYVVLGPAVALAAAVMTLWATNARQLGRTWAPLKWLGLISYASYLWNYPVTLWLEAIDFPHASVVALACTLAIAQLSWWVVEAPIARLRSSLDRRGARLSGSTPAA